MLSNYFSCKITFGGQEFNSAEHCYQWLKCTELMEPEPAERVFKAPSAALAKQISSQMPVDKILTDWNNKPHYLVKTTHPQYYPGKNRIGKLHMEIRQNLQSVSQQDLPNPANPPPSLQPGSKTTGLVSSAQVMGLDPT